MKTTAVAPASITTGYTASARPRTDPARTVHLGGLPIAIASLEEAAHQMVALAVAARGTNQTPAYITSANGQVLSLCASNPEVRDLFLAADAIHADGQPMVFASRFLSERPLPERVATTDLIHNVMSLSPAAGVRHFLLGARPEINEKAVAALKRTYPDVPEIAGHHGYFKPEEEDAIIEQVNAFAPDVLWVSLGVPLEQRFVMRMRRRLTSVGVIKTSGGLFDFLADAHVRAPKIVQDIGMEWAWRLAQEPRRLGWRYLTTNPHAVWLLMTRSR